MERNIVKLASQELENDWDNGEAGKSGGRAASQKPRDKAQEQRAEAEVKQYDAD